MKSYRWLRIDFNTGQSICWPLTTTWAAATYDHTDSKARCELGSIYVRSIGAEDLAKLAVEVARAVIDFAFETLDLSAAMVLGNVAACVVVMRLIEFDLAAGELQPDSSSR